MTRVVIALVLALVPVLVSGAEARVESYPYLDNETIGMFNAMAEAVAGPAEEFDDRYWKLAALDAFAGEGAVMAPVRYLISFSSYAVAQTAAYTPAYRDPYRQAFKQYVGKMLQPVAWKDWLDVWGGDNPLGPDNIMYSGHLAYMMTLARQLFDDRTYETTVTLRTPDGRTFETDVHALTRWIAEQASANVDTTGSPYFSVPCEPGHVFVPCNTPHRISARIYDAIYGSNFASTNDRWLQWVEDTMLDGDDGVLHDLFWPFGRYQQVPGGLPPEREPRVSGLYNAWTLWFLTPLDRPWAERLYPNFVARFVTRDGPVMVIDDTGAEGLAAFALDAIATGFAMSTARVFDDQRLYRDLQATWREINGNPTWSEDGRVFSYRNTLFPLLFENGFPLLARTTTKDLNIATNAAAGWDPTRFELPYVSEVSNPGTFVNQATYDRAEQRLVVTVNGGQATTDPTRIVIANLPPAGCFDVTRDGAGYSRRRWEGERLVVTTPALSPIEETYVVRDAGDPGGDCNRDGAITIDELITAVGIALGIQPLDRCPTADGDADGTVDVAELIRAVNAALNPCIARAPGRRRTPAGLPGR